MIETKPVGTPLSGLIRCRRWVTPSAKTAPSFAIAPNHRSRRSIPEADNRAVPDAAQALVRVLPDDLVPLGSRYSW